jgi:hypothetical protein
MGEKINEFQQENLKERGHLEDLEKYGGIILNWLGIFFGLNSFGSSQIAVMGSCEHSCKPSAFLTSSTTVSFRRHGDRTHREYFCLAVQVPLYRAFCTNEINVITEYTYRLPITYVT